MTVVDPESIAPQGDPSDPTGDLLDVNSGATNEAVTTTNEAIAAPEDPTPQRSRVQTHQYDTLALMLQAGVPVVQIATQLRCSEQSVKYYARRSSEAFNAVYDGYLDRQLRIHVHHGQRLSSMMDLAYDAIKDALASHTDSEAERKLRATTAFALMDRVVPQQGRSEATISLTQNNIQVTQEVQNTYAPVLEKFGSLLDLALRQDPTKHLRRGPEPTAVMDAEVIEECGG